MITISLCMIVKNEERVLERCLDSLEGLMDEIIIVDTGSTDRTKEIAKQYTDQVYDFTWTGNFAEARNFSFEKATKQYIYAADADEVLDEENRQAFLRLKQTLLPEIDIVQMLYCNQLQYNTTYNYDREYRPKLYKRVRTFQWQDAIHESVRLDPVVYDSEICIGHFPEGNHAGRDFQAFQNLFHKGERLSKKLHHMYARELFIAGEEEDFIQAQPVFEECVTQPDRSMDEIKEASLVLAHSYRLQGRVDSFFKYVLKDLVTEPSSEVCCELGLHFLSKKDYAEASNWFQNALEETGPVLNIQYGDAIPREKLLVCYEKLEQQALQHEDTVVAAQYREAMETLKQ